MADSVTGPAEPRATRTTCPYCGVGCGVLATPTEDGAVGIAGDGAHPANYGRLCSKGLALGDTLGAAGRVTHPTVGGRPVDFGVALDTVADRFAATIRAHGPDSVAFYVSGQLLTEDYYVANKLMKGFIGSGNIDTNSRLCMASAVAGHKRAFGSDAVANCYEDLELADLVVLVGANLAWCHPVLFRRLEAARAERGTRIVVIDPRTSATAEAADLHLKIAPGTDAHLYAGLLNHLVQAGAIDSAFVDAHTTGFAEALAAARAAAGDRATLARTLDLSEDALVTFFDWVTATPATLTVFSQGINQSATGTDKVNAIVNTHLATGRIGRPGAGAFSVTGQPNAMGGREVGGLANTLAAHMDFAPEDIDRVGRFWGAPAMARGPGLKAVDLFEAVHAGDVRALWIMATNPVVSLPNAERVRAALARCEFVVVSECFASTDTLAFADVVLPAAAWGEKDGTVTNSERRISRQRAFAEPQGEARPDWWIVCQVAKRMGFADAFGFDGPGEIFDEHARLSALDNDGRRDFDLSGLVGLDAAAYDALDPVQWPVPAGSDGRGTARLVTDGRAWHDDGRCRFVAVHPARPGEAVRDAQVLTLNSGRLRDQWHTMTRTGRSARLSRHQPGPRLYLNPDDAARRGIEPGDLVRIDNARGTLVLPAVITPAQRPGDAFVPIHWSDANAAAARVGTLVPPVTDPYSGQPQFKLTAVHVSRIATSAWVRVATRAVSARPFAALVDRALHHERVTTDYGTAWLLAFEGLAPAEIARELTTVTTDAFGGEDWVAFEDPARGHYRVALVDEGRAAFLYAIAPTSGALLSIAATETALAADATSAGPLAVLGGGAPASPLVCACHEVTEAGIEAAVEAGALDVDAVAQQTAATTGCGSCRPEVAALVAGMRRKLDRTVPAALSDAAGG